jgi:sulfur carrier protein
MQLVSNGQRQEVKPGLTIERLLTSLPFAPDGRGVAVAVNGEVVPRGAWEKTALDDGARVEIVAAVQGG